MRSTTPAESARESSQTPPAAAGGADRAEGDKVGRDTADGVGRGRAGVLKLQRAVGNRAVGRALAGRSADQNVRGAVAAEPAEPRQRPPADARTHPDQPETSVQRSLKFEIQTRNRVWAVKNAGAPDPKLLPRKYSARSKGYSEGSGEESGDRPAYLSVGRMGGPARHKGAVEFVEAEGPLVTETPLANF